MTDTQDLRTAFPSAQPVWDALNTNNYKHIVHEHLPVFTCEEAEKYTGHLPGAHIKNLFLRDKKKRMYLVTAREDTVFNIKDLKPLLNSTGSLSFGSAERLWDVLGVRPGSVTPFSLMNDKAHQIDKVLLDARVLEEEIANPHPLRCDMTVAMKSQDMLAFMKSFGHDVEVVDLSKISAEDL